MSASDERRSINAKSHSSLDLPDSSQGKPSKPLPRGRSPRPDQSLSHVWKRLWTQAPSSPRQGSGDKSLAPRRDEGLDNTRFSASTVPCIGGMVAFRSHCRRDLAPKGKGGSFCPRPCPLPADKIISLDTVKQTSVADISPVKIFLYPHFLNLCRRPPPPRTHFPGLN